MKKCSGHLMKMQNYVSLCATTSVVFLNIYYSWASKKALILTLYILKYYNVLDTLINFNHYKKTQFSMLVHHVLVIYITCIVIRLVENKYDHDLYRISRWAIIAEFTSVFNALRCIFAHTRFDVFFTYLFGIIFLLGRFIMSVGLYYDMYENTYFYVLSPYCTALIVLNTFWSEMIILKICKKKANKRTLIQNIAKYHVYVIPYLAIYASDHNKNYAENMLWIYFAYVFCYYYKPVYLSLK